MSSLYPGWDSDKEFAAKGWEKLEGKAAAKTEELFGEVQDYAKKFGRKTVFVEDCGIYRLKVVANDGAILGMKSYTFCDLPARALLLTSLAIEWDEVKAKKHCVWRAGPRRKEAP